MRILILGQGKRQEALRHLALSRGHSLPENGPWDAAALPLPRSEIAEEAADQLPRGQKVICGMTDETLERLAKKRGWTLLRILEDERYLQANACLTAEGALQRCMNSTEKAVQDMNCLVIGFGRIGKALTGMLRGLGAGVVVAARRKESRAEAGPDAISMEALPNALQWADAIFNTVPHPILGKALLARVRPEALLFELASAPYGIDQKAAEELKLHYFLESGLPGRCCPVSAAGAVLDYLEREAQHE